MRNILILAYLVALTSNAWAQQKETKVIWLKDYNILVNGYHTMGDNMMHKSHQDLGWGIEYKMGIARYQDFGIAAVLNFSSHEIDQQQMIGAFDESNYLQAGAALRYYGFGTDNYQIRPEMGILAVNATDAGRHKKTNYKGTTYRFGADYVQHLSDHMGIVLGLHYNYTLYPVNTSSEYKNFYERAPRFQLSIGLNFR